MSGVIVAASADALAGVSSQHLYAITGCIGAAVSVFVARHFPSGMWSAPSVFSIVFCVFHFGLTTVLAAGLPLPDDISLVFFRDWPSNTTIARAVVLSAAGVLAYASGAALGALGTPRSSVYKPLSARESLAITVAGSTLVIGSVLLWAAKVVGSGGAALLASSYGAFLDATARSDLSILYFTLGLGLVFVGATPPSAMKRAAVVAFILFALVALPLGLRGEVLFPACSFLAGSRSRPVFFSARNTALVAVLGLSLIAAIRESRQYGLRNASFSALDLAPHSALAEMGGSLRPAAEVIDWVDRGDRLLFGATFWAPIDRALAYVIPEWTRPPAESDDRLGNVIVQRRVAAIGFSPVAEGYRNFGDMGVFGLMWIIGAALGAAEARSASARGQLLTGVLLFPLLIFVRNDFTPIVFQVATGLALYYACAFAARLRCGYSRA